MLNSSPGSPCACPESDQLQKALASYIVPVVVCESLVSVTVLALCLQKYVSISKGNTKAADRNCDAQNSLEQQVLFKT